MKLIKEDYQLAFAQLKEQQIVINNKYASEYSGVISSIGPDIQALGLLTCIALYESNPEEESGKRRNKICKCILNIIKGETDNDTILYTWLQTHYNNKEKLIDYKLDKAIVSLKVALRFFEETKN